MSLSIVTVRKCPLYVTPGSRCRRESNEAAPSAKIKQPSCQGRTGVLGTYLELELDVVGVVVLLDEVGERLRRRDAVEVVTVLVVGDHVQHLSH